MLVMRLLHRCDDDNEFPSWMPDRYDAAMFIATLFAALALAASHHRVALTFDPEIGLSAAICRIAAGEAAALWRPYDVDVELTAPDSSDSVGVHVVAAREAGPALFGAPGSLGAIEFEADGSPHPVISVFVTRLLRMITTAPGWRSVEWPPLYRDRVVGRVVGRVIAHELGHFLLRSRDHSTAGLMRAVQRVDELVQPERTRFAVEPPITARTRTGRAPTAPATADRRRRAR
jgi:hypothetical protein